MIRSRAELASQRRSERVESSRGVSEGRLEGGGGVWGLRAEAGSISEGGDSTRAEVLSQRVVEEEVFDQEG